MAKAILIGGREDKDGNITDTIGVEHIQELGWDDLYWIDGWEQCPLRWILISLEL